MPAHRRRVPPSLSSLRQFTDEARLQNAPRQDPPLLEGAQLCSAVDAWTDLVFCPRIQAVHRVVRKPTVVFHRRPASADGKFGQSPWGNLKVVFCAQIVRGLVAAERAPFWYSMFGRHFILADAHQDFWRRPGATLPNARKRANRASGKFSELILIIFLILTPELS